MAKNEAVDPTATGAEGGGAKSKRTDANGASTALRCAALGAILVDFPSKSRP